MFTPDEVAKKYSLTGERKINQKISKTFVLATFAGMFIAFGAFGSQVVSVEAGNPSMAKFLSSLVFPVGLLMVIIAGAELFTGNSLMIISVLDKRAGIQKMLQNWLVVYVGNLVGSIVVALLLSYSHIYAMYDGKLAEMVVNTANTKESLSFEEAILRGILCNILVCIAVWISFAAEETAGKILGLFLPIMLFVISGYEHCVANMYFIPAGIFSANEYQVSANIPSWSGFVIKNLLPVTIGNIIGGALVVGVGYFYVYLHKSDETTAKDI